MTTGAREEAVTRRDVLGLAGIEAAAIPVEDIDGPVPFVSGAEDAVWDAESRQKHAAERLRDRDDSNEIPISSTRGRAT